MKSFSSSFLTSGRLDAEYYQEKYDQLLLKLNNYQFKKLKDIVSITKSIEPGSDAYQQEGLPFIRVSNLSKFGITESDIYIDHNLKVNLESLKPQKDTILLTKDGTVGIAYKVDENSEFITSGAILHLKIKKGVLVLSDYLTLVLNSVIVQLQAERDAGGSIIVHWRVSEIENVIIPIVDIQVQKRISEKIQLSFAKRKESLNFLEIAKSGVEIAIETNEKKAITWMEEQLKILGVTLGE